MGHMQVLQPPPPPPLTPQAPLVGGLCSVLCIGHAVGRGTVQFFELSARGGVRMLARQLAHVYWHGCGGSGGGGGGGGLALYRRSARLPATWVAWFETGSRSICLHGLGVHCVLLLRAYIC